MRRPRQPRTRVRSPLLEPSTASQAWPSLPSCPRTSMSTRGLGVTGNSSSGTRSSFTLWRSQTWRFLFYKLKVPGDAASGASPCAIVPTASAPHVSLPQVLLILDICPTLRQQKDYESQKAQLTVRVFILFFIFILFCFIFSTGVTVSALGRHGCVWRGSACCPPGRKRGGETRGGNLPPSGL